MNRSLSILWGVLFTSVIAGALTLSMLKLLQPKKAKSEADRLSQELVSASPAPVIVGTEHPVVVNPTPMPAPTPNFRSKAREPLTTPTSQEASLVENDSQLDPQQPQESARAKAEQAREKAERMRARAEDLYQRRLISEEAYRKCQAEYQEELAKYEDQIAKYHNATTGTGAANE